MLQTASKAFFSVLAGSSTLKTLASRYGNPDTILRRDYIPALPGVNMPGKYEDYAKDPGVL